MTETNDMNIENKKEEIVLGFCSKFQPQLAPHAVGPGKTLINYKIYYFPCMGDKCTDSWCHEHQMCRHACEHLEDFHPVEDSVEREQNFIADSVRNDEDEMENDRAGR